MYEWLQEANDYGLVDVDTAGNPTPRADYTVLSSLWNKVSPVSTPIAQYTATNSAPACPTNSGAFVIAMSSLPATPTNDGKADWEPNGQLLVGAVVTSAPVATSIPVVTSQSPRLATTPTAASSQRGSTLATSSPAPTQRSSTRQTAAATSSMSTRVTTATSSAATASTTATPGSAQNLRTPIGMLVGMLFAILQL